MPGRITRTHTHPSATEQAFPYTLIICVERLTLGLSHQYKQLLKIPPEHYSNYGRPAYKETESKIQETILLFSQNFISSYFRESIIFGILFIISSVFSTNILIMTPLRLDITQSLRKPRKATFSQPLYGEIEYPTLLLPNKHLIHRK